MPVPIDVNVETQLESTLETEVRDALKTAVKRWRRKEMPDDFRTITTVLHQGEKRLLQATIRHKETFPLGAQAFVADLRKPPYGPDDLLLRHRIDVVDGIII